MRLIQVLFLVLICAACNSKNVGEPEMQHVELQMTNLPIDSCSFRINHSVTGREIFSQERVDLSKPIKIPRLENDMYIAVFSWPRTLVSHHVLRNRQFDKENDEDIFQLTKPLYINDETRSSCRIRVVNNVSLEELERQGAEILKFENVACKECDLADRYWALYEDFFDRKNKLIDSAKRVFYDCIEKDDLKKGNRAFLALEELKTHFVKDEILNDKIKKLIVQNPESSVSTFFLFYQLYNYREFDKFKSTYKLLKNDAQKGKYYRMVQKQYEARP